MRDAESSVLKHGNSDIRAAEELPNFSHGEILSISRLVEDIKSPGARTTVATARAKCDKPLMSEVFARQELSMCECRPCATNF